MKLSVIIPVWNTGENAVKLIQQLLRQYADLEIIAVDDGSTDDSLQKLEEVSRCSLARSRVKVVHQENAGASAARNTGIRMARGEYSCFLFGFGRRDKRRNAEENGRENGPESATRD